MKLAYVTLSGRGAIDALLSEGRGAPVGTTACAASGHRPAASASAAAMDTISPAILAKRLARPRMAT